MMIKPEDLAGESEDSQQQAFFCWAALNIKQYPQLKWMHAIPNGGSRDIREAVKLKSTGVRSGVWDIFLPVPIQYPYEEAKYHGLYIEMKKPGRQKEKNGGLSDEQIEFRDYVNSLGYCTVVCYNWIEARNAIIKYVRDE